MSRSDRLLVLFFVFVSGACSLIYETIWLRSLKLVFGNTTIAASVTIALFMGGLAVGAWLVRARVDHLPREMRAYGVLELLIAASALATLPLLGIADPMYVHFYRWLLPPASVLLGVQIVLSSAVLFVPTCLMGMTLPLLSAWSVEHRDAVGLRFGLLYAANTLGAMLGAFGSGFFLVGRLGVQNTLFVAAGANLAVAIAALWTQATRSRRFEATGEAKPAGTKASHAPLPRATTGQGTRLVDSWLFVSGFVAMGYEVVWIRTSIPYLKATTYTFSAILSVYLLGYSVGVFGGTWLLRRGSKHWASSAWIMQAIGLCGVLYVFELVGLSHLFSVTFREWSNRLLFGMDRYFAVLWCMAFFFLPSFIMGLNVPLLVQLRPRGAVGAGNVVATAYFINTLGSVAGPLFTGLCFIPALGSQRTVQALGLCDMAVVVASLVAAQKLGPPRGSGGPTSARQAATPAQAGVPAERAPGRAALSLHALLLLAAASVTFATPRGYYLGWLNKIEGKDEEAELVDAVEGITTTASVHHYIEQDFKVITTAGINVAGDQIALRQTQKAQGHIPVILHGDPKSVLTVGYGSGELTKLLTLHDIPRITCVELSPEMVELSKRHFAHINLGRDLEERVRMVYMDAKNYIHLTDERYDVVLNDAIWPGLFAENSSLYTKEYFADGKRILGEDGIYSSWLPLSLSGASLKSIVRTFSEVFENTILVYPNFTPSPHILLIGQKNAHRYSYDRMREQFDKRAVRESLAMIGVASVDDILAFVFADGSSIAPWAADAAVNSDEFPFVEFDRDLYRSGFNVFLHWENLYKMMLLMHPADVGAMLSFGDVAERDRTLAKLEIRQKAVGHLLMSFMYLDPDKNRRAVEAGLAIDPDNVSLLHRREELSRE